METETKPLPPEFLSGLDRAVETATAAERSKERLQHLKEIFEASVTDGGAKTPEEMIAWVHATIEDWCNSDAPWRSDGGPESEDRLRPLLLRTHLTEYREAALAFCQEVLDGLPEDARYLTNRGFAEK